MLYLKSHRSFVEKSELEFQSLGSNVVLDSTHSKSFLRRTNIHLWDHNLTEGKIMLNLQRTPQKLVQNLPTGGKTSLATVSWNGHPIPASVVVNHPQSLSLKLPATYTHLFAKCLIRVESEINKIMIFLCAKWPSSLVNLSSSGLFLKQPSTAVATSRSVFTDSPWGGTCQGHRQMFPFSFPLSFSLRRGKSENTFVSVLHASKKTMLISYFKKIIWKLLPSIRCKHIISVTVKIRKIVRIMAITFSASAMHPAHSWHCGSTLSQEIYKVGVSISPFYRSGSWWERLQGKKVKLWSDTEQSPGKAHILTSCIYLKNTFVLSLVISLSSFLTHTLGMGFSKFP